MSQDKPGTDQTGTVEDRGSHDTTQKVRPLITSDAFNSEASTSWDEWIGHFESVAKVNGSDKATCLLWLEVRMMGKAQNAWKQLSREAKAYYDTTKSALRKRFEPDSRRQLYAVEFQTRRHQKGNRGRSWPTIYGCLLTRHFPTWKTKRKSSYPWTVISPY